VRWRLRVALLYNVQPFNLIPDFVPVVGFADNVAVILWALRGVLRVSGTAEIARQWPGTADGLEVLFGLLGMRETPET
jgi:uncharacterized membrane protein YkvA (DUF1232 family)